MEDENSMFCITELMPSCQGGDCYFKYLSASVFLTTLVWNNVVWNEEPKQKKKPSPQKNESETNEAQCSGK